MDMAELFSNLLLVIACGLRAGGSILLLNEVFYYKWSCFYFLYVSLCLGRMDSMFVWNHLVYFHHEHNSPRYISNVNGCIIILWIYENLAML